MAEDGAGMKPGAKIDQAAGRKERKLEARGKRQEGRG